METRATSDRARVLMSKIGELVGNDLRATEEDSHLCFPLVSVTQILQTTTQTLIRMITAQFLVNLVEVGSPEVSG